jgi:hypothetical protein
LRWWSGPSAVLSVAASHLTLSRSSSESSRNPNRLWLPSHGQSLSGMAQYNNSTKASRASQTLPLRTHSQSRCTTDREERYIRQKEGRLAYICFSLATTWGLAQCGGNRHAAQSLKGLPDIPIRCIFLLCGRELRISGNVESESPHLATDINRRCCAT